MGAVKVIGSYTGFRVLQANEVRDGSKIVLQSLGLMLSSAPEADKKLCDIWVNNELPWLMSTNFSPQNVRAIIEGGEANARALLPELRKIARWQHAQGIRPKRHILKADTTFSPLKSIEIDEKNANTAVFIKQKFGIKPNQRYTSGDIKHGLNQLYGSLFFDKINVNVDTLSLDNTSTIRLRAHENSRTVFKVGVHYDTDDAAGILLNTTLRNVVGNDSRLVGTIDFAENPKTHLNFYQFIGPKARFRWTLDGLLERSIRNDFLFIKASEGLLKSRDKYLNNYFRFAVGSQLIADKNTLFFLEMRAINDLTKPQRDPRNIPIPNQVNFLQNKSSHYGFAAGGLKNTLNMVFFPSKGQRLTGEIKLGLGHNSEFTTYQYIDSTKIGTEKEIITSHNQNYIRYRLDERRWIPLSKNLSLGISAALGAGFSLNHNLSKREADTIPLDNPETFYIGGMNVSERDNTLNFIGLRKAEIEFSQYITFGLSGQYQLDKNVYLTPTVNIGRFSDKHNVLFSHILDWDLKKDITEPLTSQATQPTHILGYGLNVGYLSKIGPVNLLVHSNTFTHSWYVFFSFGFKIS